MKEQDAKGLQVNVAKLIFKASIIRFLIEWW